MSLFKKRNRRVQVLVSFTVLQVQLCPRQFVAHLHEVRDAHHGIRLPQPRLAF